MMRWVQALGLLVCTLSGCSESASAPPVSDAAADTAVHIGGVPFTVAEIDAFLTLSPRPALPPSPSNAVADAPAARDLGKRLFVDPRLSRTGRFSCASCHHPHRDWTDGLRTARATGSLNRNTMSLWNVAYNRWYFWDGRRDSLWAQALVPVEDPRELATSRVAVYRLLRDDAELRAGYEETFGVFPELARESLPEHARPVPAQPSHPHHQAWLTLNDADRQHVNRVFAGVGKALEAFQRGAVTGPAPFDEFVASLRDESKPVEPLSPSALRGLKLFVGRGNCVLCHSGPLLTDREFHNLGLARTARELDTGRFHGIEELTADPFNGLGEFSDDRTPEHHKALRFVTQKPSNLGEFKTPSLRNVARTAPYMHDGRFHTLADVLSFYSKLDQQPAVGHREETLVQLNLTPMEIRDLIAFLESLSSPLP